MTDNQKNADRFKGFADIYDSARPFVPLFPVEVIEKYLKKSPDTVVDLGCGTGLSSMIWCNHAKSVIGIEPSDDMISVAMTKSADNLSFIKGFSDNTGLCDNSASVVICSQSFHWMNPQTTLSEVNRILKSGGIFATVDCDWPPIAGFEAEKAYSELYDYIKTIEREYDDINDTFKRYPKSEHLNNIKRSGYFAYCREIVFANHEKCTGDRLYNLLMSQGSTQIVLKKHPELIADRLNEFKTLLDNIYGDKQFDIEFCYRMRIGIKA